MLTILLLNISSVLLATCRALVCESVFIDCHNKVKNDLVDLFIEGNKLYRKETVLL